MRSLLGRGILCGLSLFVFVLSAAQEAEAKEWEHLQDCVLVPSFLNDGDSFLIRHGDREVVIRLYFVDCPEVSGLFPDRVDEQAKYFRINRKETLRLGEVATQFTKELLADGFDVYTQWEDGWGQAKRYTGIISVQGRPLSEILIENGLARIKGFRPGSAWPGGRSASDMLTHLAKTEQTARDRRVGGWADKIAGVPAEVKAQPQELTIAQRTNLNSSGPEQLTRLPSVGDTIAQRIIAGRPWRDPADLRKIRGIGDQAMERLLPLVTVVNLNAPRETADFYRKDAERWRNQFVFVKIEDVSRKTWPSPDGFAVVQAHTGDGKQTGGSIPLFLPEENLTRVLEYYMRADLGRTKAYLYQYQGEDVLVIPRTAQPTDPQKATPQE
ncbi:MAG: helix-hairpin-helix domain-containing protein [Verrucomicrobiota bacterium]